MMNIEQAIKERHSVRSYTDKPLGENEKNALQAAIDEYNRESGLHIQLVTDEPKAFDSFLARYGKFAGVKNYIAMIGAKDARLDEKCGYYGEKLVLLAQQLGLNTCWVGLTYKKVKQAFKIVAGEKLCIVIAIGYGQTQGIPHKSKPLGDIAHCSGNMPDWFRNGAEAALLAPTAMNQQKFMFSLDGDRVNVKAGTGFYTKVDLGIVKYHFELGAGKEHFDGCK